jgi:hypothetical protein
MAIKHTKAHKYTKVPYIINIIFLLHVSATLEVILRKVDYRGYIAEIFETMHNCKILSFKMYGLKCIYIYIYKYKIQVKFWG